MRSLATVGALVLLWGCSGSAARVCPSEKHAADPDGRGQRCIDDTSSCSAPSDCPQPDDSCCVATCSDQGDDVFACTTDCEVPDCTEGSCTAGLVCAPGLDECSAHCVPDDLGCPDGTVAADPAGTGQWTCIRADSTCEVPADCAGLGDACCAAACLEVGNGRYDCARLCDEGVPGGGGDADADADAEAPEMCYSDEECGPGWTCIIDACRGNQCVQQAQCDSAADCTIAYDASQCCWTCPDAVPVDWTVNGCWVPAEGGFAPSDCTPGACDAALCPDVDCAWPTSVDCVNGQCVAVW